MNEAKHLETVTKLESNANTIITMINLISNQMLTAVLEQSSLWFVIITPITYPHAIPFAHEFMIRTKDSQMQIRQILSFSQPSISKIPISFCCLRVLMWVVVTSENRERRRTKTRMISIVVLIICFWFSDAYTFSALSIINSIFLAYSQFYCIFCQSRPFTCRISLFSFKNNLARKIGSSQLDGMLAKNLYVSNETPTFEFCAIEEKSNPSFLLATMVQLIGTLLTASEQYILIRNQWLGEWSMPSFLAEDSLMMQVSLPLSVLRQLQMLYCRSSEQTIYSFDCGLSTNRPATPCTQFSRKYIFALSEINTFSTPRTTSCKVGVVNVKKETFGKLYTI